MPDSSQQGLLVQAWSQPCFQVLNQGGSGAAPVQSQGAEPPAAAPGERITTNRGIRRRMNTAGAAKRAGEGREMGQQQELLWGEHRWTGGALKFCLTSITLTLLSPRMCKPFQNKEFKIKNSE